MLESPFTVAAPLVLLKLLAQERHNDAIIMRKKHHQAWYVHSVRANESQSEPVRVSQSQ